MRSRRTLVLLLGLACLAAPVAGQTFVSPAETKLQLLNDETATQEVQLYNPVNRTLAGQAQVVNGGGDGFDVRPGGFTVEANETQRVWILANGSALEVGEHSAKVKIQLVDRRSAATEHHTVNVTAFVEAPPLVFSQFENPLPSPLDGITGAFLLEMSTWILLAYAGMRLNDAAVDRSLTWVPKRVRNKILDRVDGPLFAFLLAGGIRYTWRLVPRSSLVGAIADLLTAVVVVTAAFLFYRIVDSVLLYYGRKGGPQTSSRWDDVAIPVLRKVLIAGIGAFAFFYALQSLGVDLGWLVAGGVVVGLVISNSLGPTLANLFSGLFILMDRPFREGDDIRLDSGEVCRVEKIGLRSTRLYYYRNHEVIVAPNNQLENSRVVNLAYPDRRYRMHLPVGVAYGSPVAEVREILLDTARQHPDVLEGGDSEPDVFYDEFGDNSLQFRLAFYIKEVGDRFRIASELRNRIDKAFRKQDITIPFPQRTVWRGQDEDFDPLVPEDPEDEDAERGD